MQTLYSLKLPAGWTAASKKVPVCCIAGIEFLQTKICFMDPHIIRLCVLLLSGLICKLDPLRGCRMRVLTLQVLIIRNLGPSLFRNWSSNTCMHIAKPHQEVSTTKLPNDN